MAALAQHPAREVPFDLDVYAVVYAHAELVEDGVSPRRVVEVDEVGVGNEVEGDLPLVGVLEDFLDSEEDRTERGGGECHGCDGDEEEDDDGRAGVDNVRNKKGLKECQSCLLIE